jgi:hypothetical protein
MGENMNECMLLVGKPKGKGPLRRSRSGWEDNIKMGPGEIGWGSMDLIGLPQDRLKWRALVKVLMNLRVPQDAGKFLSGCTQLVTLRVVFSSTELVS